MAKKQQSKSARIRKLLEQGKSVKHIAATVKCTPALVYQVKAYDKKKMEGAWMTVTTSTSKKPIGIPKDVYADHMPPLDYYQPKQSLWARFKSWLVA